MNSYPINEADLTEQSRMYFEMHRREKKELKRNANILGLALIIMYVLTFLVSSLLYFSVSAALPWDFIDKNRGVLESAISLVSYVIAFLLPCVAAVVMLKIPKSIAFPLKAPRLDLAVASVFVCFGVSLIGRQASEFVSFGISNIFGVVPTMPDFTPPEGTLPLILHTISMTVAAAFLEELFFRGVVLQSLRRFGDGFAIIISSIFFAMAHGNLVQGVNVLIVGMVIGFFVLRTGSLWTGIIIHFANNAVAVGMDLAFQALENHGWGTEVLVGMYFVIYVFGGLIAAAYLFGTYPGILRLAPSRSRLTMGERYRVFFLSAMPIVAILVTLLITSRFFELA